MAMPTGSDLLSSPSHSTLHSIHFNVKAFGAVGDGSTDDTTAITNTITAADAAGAAVYFPSTADSYKVTSTINLSSYSGLHFIGGSSSGTGTNGGIPPQVSITAASSVSPVFKWAGSGGTANVTFENLSFASPDCAIKFSDGAGLRIFNCSFAVTDTGGADNTCVLLENFFWAWFRDCSFNAPSTSAGDGAVILRGKEPSPNVDHCYLIHFDHCRFWNNGVYYRDQNDIAVGGTNAERIMFENCDGESFAGTSALIEFTKSAGTDWGGLRVKYLSLRNIALYDYSGSPAVCRFSIPNGIENFFAENVNAPRLFEGSSAYVKRGLVSGFQGTPVVDSGGTEQAGGFQFSNDFDFSIRGDTGLPGTLKVYNAATTFANLYSSTADQLATDNSVNLAGTGKFIQFLENGTNDAAAGAANTARLYCRDNGAGKSQLVVRFNSGAVQVLATEP